MHANKRLALPTARFAILLCTAFLCLSAQAKPLSGAAPDFTLKTLDGSNFRLEEHRGEVLFINFWATWCGPCRQEMPLLNELHERYSAAGFKILGVNVEEDSAGAATMAKKMGLSFPILFDTESNVSQLYNVDAMPSSVLVDRNGKMRYLHRGYKPGYEEEYRAQIKELIRE